MITSPFVSEWSWHVNAYHYFVSMDTIFSDDLHFQYNFPIHPLSGKQKPHQHIRHDARISRPPIVILQACQNGGGCAVEDKERAPDLRNAPSVAHAFGGKVGMLQSGEAFDDGLFGKQAVAENGKHQRVDGDRIPIHRVRPSENQYRRKKGGKDNRRNALCCGLRHGSAYQP